MRPHAGIFPTDPDHGLLVLREEGAEDVDTLEGFVTVRRGVRRHGHSEGAPANGMQGTALCAAADAER